jgi:aspartyl-tRNA synthetase
MRTHYSVDLSKKSVGEKVTLCGWAQRYRNHGGLIFIDLRDRGDIVQVVFNPEPSNIFDLASQLRNEYVIQVTGTVCARPDGMININMITGEIEVIASDLKLLNTSDPLPLAIEECTTANETTRLKYRYLDLRRREMHDRLVLRTKIVKEIRLFLDAQNFMEIETPILTKATPEGARDYLVPSRVHPGSFYALPQSPQLFKQLLMISGMDRYYQIARCFRDEDLRADRQPEFTQLDVEAAFTNEDEIQNILESMMKLLFKKFLDIDLLDFPKLTYKEAMEKYGSDKPDLRIPMELININDLVKTIDFKVFADPANSTTGRVVALRVPNGCSLLSRKSIDDYALFITKYGAKGLAYLKVNNLESGISGLQSPILKFLPESIAFEILKRAQAQTGDIIFFGAGESKIVSDSMGALRIKIGNDLGLVEKGFKPLWVIDFPMFEFSDGRWNPLHHPFTSSKSDDISELKNNPGECVSRAYDMIINGSELGGGSIRISNRETQSEVFRILNINEQEAQEKFGFFLEAMRYGCPPHGGIAFGIDRIISIIAGCDSLRDVIAFPKTQTASCPLTDAPSRVDKSQLDEVGVFIKE